MQYISKLHFFYILANIVASQIVEYTHLLTFLVDWTLDMSIGGAISDVLGTRNLVFDQLKVLFNFGNIIKHGKKTKDGIKVFGYPKIRIGVFDLSL